MTMRRLALIAVLAPTLSSCDAWPTTVRNESREPVAFRWRHQDYAEWSGWQTIAAGQVITLARAHYVEDFTGIEVEAQGQTYSPDSEQLSLFRRTCARSLADHLTTLGDCKITYSGNGTFSVKRIQ